MEPLKNPKHEQFAINVAKGLNATQAYISAGYSSSGAGQSAGKLLKNPEILSRIRDLQAEVSAATVQLEISSRNARVEALQGRWGSLRAKLEQLIAERGEEMKGEIAGASTGLLCRDYKGKDANRAVYRVDSGLVSLFSELRLIERQAAEELGQWDEKNRAGDGKGKKFSGSLQDLLELYATVTGAPPEVELTVRPLIPPAQPSA